MLTRTFSVPNISCHHCVQTIKRELGALPEVSSVEGDVQAKTITASFQDDKTLDLIKTTMEEIGYPVAS